MLIVVIQEIIVCTDCDDTIQFSLSHYISEIVGDSCREGTLLQQSSVTDIY